MSHKGTIHQGGYKENMMGESIGNEIATRNEHEIFSKEITNKLVSALLISSRERVFVERLMFSTISQVTRDLLREYENVVADKIHRRVKHDIENIFDLKLDSEVDYNYAAHAKLSSLLTELKEKMKEKNENI